MQQKTIFCQSKDSLSWLLAANYTRQAQTKDTSATPQTELKDPIVTPSCRQVGHHRLQSKLLFAISCCAAASSAGSTTASAETASNDSGCATASATATFATASASGPPATEDDTGDPVARSSGWGTAGTGDTPAWPAGPCCTASQGGISAFLRQLLENKLWLIKYGPHNHPLVSPKRTTAIYQRQASAVAEHGTGTDSHWGLCLHKLAILTSTHCGRHGHRRWLRTCLYSASELGRKCKAEHLPALRALPTLQPSPLVLATHGHPQTTLGEEVEVAAQKEPQFWQDGQKPPFELWVDIASLKLWKKSIPGKVLLLI